MDDGQHFLKVTQERVISIIDLEVSKREFPNVKFYLIFFHNIECDGAGIPFRFDDVFSYFGFALLAFHNVSH